jgi:hypothetical protein
MTLDSRFAAGMREQLIDTVSGGSQLARSVHRRRLAVGVVGIAVAAALLTAGTLVVVGGEPGGHIVTPFGNPVAESNTGTATVELGERPAGANAVSFSITCTSAGAFEVSYADTYGPSGTSWECGGGSILPVGHTITIAEHPLAAGQTSFVVTTDDDTTWTVEAQYATSVTTPWGINANGQTYGTPNENGIPDLTAAQATNGKVGYYESDAMWDGAEGDTLPVYESDGTTVIGEFRIDSSEFRLGND